MDLRDTEVPRIKVWEGAPNEFTIDVLKAHEAIQAVMAQNAEILKAAGAIDLP